MSIFAFKEADDIEARRMSVVAYVSGKTEKKARKNYLKVKGSKFPKTGHYAVEELPKKEGKEIVKLAKKDFNNLAAELIAIEGFIDNSEEDSDLIQLLKKRVSNKTQSIENVKESLSLLRIDIPLEGNIF